MTETGPLGDEAARLLGAAQDWLHRMVLDPATARVATGSAECCWCPLCQLIAALRGNRPELTERWSVALTELQTALAGLLRAAGESPPPAERPARTVHRIDLSDQPGTDQPGGSVADQPGEPAAGQPGDDG